MPSNFTRQDEQAQRLVALAETLAETSRPAPASTTARATYPFARAIEALKARPAISSSAPIPVELGGLGVTSVHDLVVASSRLARGERPSRSASTCTWRRCSTCVRRWQIAVAAGQRTARRRFAASLDLIAHDRVVLAAAVSEPGQDLTRPRRPPTRTDAGWRVDGRKIFCTMSPAANDLYTAVTFTDDEGIERYGVRARARPTRPASIVHDDWDALGMRASGSHSVTLRRRRALPTRPSAAAPPSETRCRTWSAT